MSCSTMLLASISVGPVPAMMIYGAAKYIEIHPIPGVIIFGILEYVETGKM